MSLGLYILDGKTPVKVDDTIKWARWFETSGDKRIVKQTKVGDVGVSTVFLGVDHNWSAKGDPVLFETMTFGNEDQQQHRYTTWADAELGHEIIVAEMRELETA